MGCMHSWVWGETFPDFMDALMPLACQPVPIAGRNRVWRKMVMDGIRNDSRLEERRLHAPAARGDGDRGRYVLYRGRLGSTDAKELSTREATDASVEESAKRFAASHDANDLLYAVKCLAEL